MLVGWSACELQRTLKLRKKSRYGSMLRPSVMARAGWHERLSRTAWGGGSAVVRRAFAASGDSDVAGGVRGGSTWIAGGTAAVLAGRSGFVRKHYADRPEPCVVRAAASSAVARSAR